MNQQLIQETKQSVYEYNPRLITGIEQVCNFIQTGKETEGLSLLSKVLEGIQWTIQAISGINKITPNCLPNEELIFDHINEMLSGLEMGDYVLVTDLLEYEILPFLNQVQDSLNNPV